MLTQCHGNDDASRTEIDLEKTMDKMELLRATRELTGISDLNDLITQAGVLEQYLNTPKITRASSTIKLSLHEFRRHILVDNPIKGLIPMEIWDHQTMVMNTIQNNRLSMVSSARQMGKTTMISLYVLWCAMSHYNQTILICSNKRSDSQALSIKVKIAYENLPEAFKVEVIQYNSDTITFSNGSKIVFRSTTPDATRGLSINALILDEMAFVGEAVINKFWQAVQLSLKSDAKVILMSTPTEFNGLFVKLWLETNDFTKICLPWNMHPRRDQAWADNNMKILGMEKFKLEYEAKIPALDQA